MKTKTKKQKVIRFEGGDFYFDDCEICRVMKKADENGKKLVRKRISWGFQTSK